MTSQQIKSYVALRQFDQITRFEAVNDEQIVRAYQFTTELQSIGARLLAAATTGGAWAIVGERGCGKSHLLALVRSLGNNPRLLYQIEDHDARSVFEHLAVAKLPGEGLPSLTIGFDTEKGINYINIFPPNADIDVELAAAGITPQLDDLIARYIDKSDQFAIFIDGISPFLKQAVSGGVWVDWLAELVAETRQRRLALMVTLDQDLVEGSDFLSERLRLLFQFEHLNIDNFAILIDQKIFRKTPQQRRAIEALYQELHHRIPYFSGTQERFTQLYPVHPIVLQLSGAMRKYARSFSLFGFLTAVSARAMVRRGLNLICLDDMFESFEFDLRKSSFLTDAFRTYDHLFTKIIPGLGHPHSLYAKMLLKGLLLLSFTGRNASELELADAVMLYDDREPKTFERILHNILQELQINDAGILLENRSGLSVYRFQLGGLTQSLVTERPALSAQTQQDLETPISATHTQLALAAKQIADDDFRLDRMLVAAGKKHFKDWPFAFESNGAFRDRAELNIKWRGSLRKGILKFGGSMEIYANMPQDRRPLCEYDWQITVLRAFAPMTIPPPPDAPTTMFYWSPKELSDEERNVLKQLLVVQLEGSRLFEDANIAAEVTATLENRVTEIFAQAYLQAGQLVSVGDRTFSLRLSGTFINTTLTKMLDEPLGHRYPRHPRFEELLDPEYVTEMTSWMFNTQVTPTPDQQTYLEQFARPLELLSSDNGGYKIDLNSASTDGPLALLQQALTGRQTPLSKLDAYKLVRCEPCGLQRPALLLILATMAANKQITLVDELGEAIHNEEGLHPDLELSDFSAIIPEPPAATANKESLLSVEQLATPGSIFAPEQSSEQITHPPVPPTVRLNAVEKYRSASSAKNQAQPSAQDSLPAKTKLTQQKSNETETRASLAEAKKSAAKEVPAVAETSRLSATSGNQNSSGNSSGSKGSPISHVLQDELPKAASKRSSQTGAGEYTIMVVDNDPTVHMVLALAAESLNCRVEKASDGVEALEKLQQYAQPIHLVISDLKMPHMNGIQLYHKMQANPLLRDVPFVILTSLDGDQELTDALEKGIEDYWLKPFRMQEIKVRIKRLLRKRLSRTNAYALAAFPSPNSASAANGESIPIIPSNPEAKPIPTAPTVAASNSIPLPTAIVTADITSAPTEVLNEIPPQVISEPVKKKQHAKMVLPIAEPDPGKTTPLRIPLTSAQAQLLQHPPIPHPPVPQAQTASPSAGQTRDMVSFGRNNDELAIRSITADLPGLNSYSGPLPEFEIEQEDIPDKSKTAKAQDEADVITSFTIKISEPSAMAFDIMQLYNQFWDICRRGQPGNIPEYEEFKELVATRAQKLKKQFNCEELIFTVFIEDDVAHVDCQVKQMSNFLKAPPKYRVI